MMLNPIQQSRSDFDSNNHTDRFPRTCETSGTCETSDKCVSSCAAYGNVCPCAARSAGRAAHKKMDVMLENSVLFDGLPQFHTVDDSEIILGSKLGTGGFSNVNACCLQGLPLDESMAIKYLKREVMVKQKCFENGAADLATEACFLARLDHPNIVKLRAVTAGSVESNVSSGKEGGFFIVVDRLVETLYDRIQRWKNHAEQLPNSIFYRLSREYRETQRAMLVERLNVAVDIANVMDYLQGLKVIFRDLKPDNVGFDKNGTLKLFDFGLAKEQKPTMRFEDGTYKMTSKTGSRRYMAPEGRFLADRRGESTLAYFHF
jgi:serine/threonine protein kinase